MPTYYVHCEEIAGGPSVAPCADVGGLSYAPVMVDVAGTAIDYQNAADLYVWVVASLCIVFIIGLTVGSIIRVLRSV